MTTRLRPELSEEEWALVEAFVGCTVVHREAVQSAFWEDTFANEERLPDNYKRLAWLGDRVLNLALADQREAEAPPQRPWAETEPLLADQSGRTALRVARSWPAEVLALLRAGNTWRGRDRGDLLPHYAEAMVGLVFRAGGYGAARRFVAQHWGAGAHPSIAVRFPDPPASPESE